MPSYEIDANGRWKGAVTSRPLPWDDSSRAELGDDEREQIAGAWWLRSAREARVGEGFRVVAEELRMLHVGTEVQALADRACDDEVRHARLCHEVAEWIGGKPLARHPPLALRIPKHARVSAPVRSVLHAIGQSCLNETFACAVLESSLRVTLAPLPHAAVRELMSDEVDHARIGWAIVASLDQPSKLEVETHLPGMIAANLKEWLAPDRTYPQTPNALRFGVLSDTLVRDALRVALEELVLAGFARNGLTVAGSASTHIARAESELGLRSL